MERSFIHDLINRHRAYSLFELERMVLLPELTREEFGKKLGSAEPVFVILKKAVKVARKAGLPEKIALRACLQDQVYKAGSEATSK